MLSNALRALANKLPTPVSSRLRSIRASISTAIRKRRYQFSYSREFYEKGYHELLADEGATSLEFWEQRGYRDRLMAVCDALEQRVDMGACRTVLEIACMYGKTAFWIGARYPQVRIWGFDFAQRFVDAAAAANPLGDRFTVWQCDATDIHRSGDRFDGFFDLVTCLDVTEHLPDDAYRKMLLEIGRVSRVGGHLLLMQGNTVHVEHIHVLPESELVRDVEASGFRHIATLPERHHLFERLPDQRPGFAWSGQ
jgi:SAM-dependent methyltransferase